MSNFAAGLGTSVQLVLFLLLLSSEGNTAGRLCRNQLCYGGDFFYFLFLKNLQISSICQLNRFLRMEESIVDKP